MNAARHASYCLHLISLSAIVLGACGDAVTVNEVDKGREGESCRARNDCESGLVCLDLTCVSAATQSSQVAPDGGVISNRGGEGESCQRRGDCESPLACIDQVCRTSLGADAAVEFSGSRGKRGESCEASNDCESGLACIAMRCLESDFDLSYVAKECFRVQCAAADDCCKDFKPAAGYTQAQCDTMKTNCETAGIYPPPTLMPPAVTSNDCTYYSNYCVCRLDCAQEQCVATTGQHCLVDGQCLAGAGGCVNNRCAQCAVDLDCLSPSIPFCVSDACVQCRTDTDCSVSGSRCVQGSCQAGCTRNEHCGQLQACQAGECVDVGCATDRQCYFLTGDDRSKCVDAHCVTPCESDAECVDPFHICEAGVCAFVGCESDEECRAALNLQNQSALSLDRAVCREPEQ